MMHISLRSGVCAVPVCLSKWISHEHPGDWCVAVSPLHFGIPSRWYHTLHQRLKYRAMPCRGHVLNPCEISDVALYRMVFNACHGSYTR